MHTQKEEILPEIKGIETLSIEENCSLKKKRNSHQ